MRILSTDEKTVVLTDSALRAPVTIASDRYGLNHILAENDEDVLEPKLLPQAVEWRKKLEIGKRTPTECSTQPLAWLRLSPSRA